jgi:hypothetical protein
MNASRKRQKSANAEVAFTPPIFTHVEIVPNPDFKDGAEITVDGADISQLSIEFDRKDSSTGRVELRFDLDTRKHPNLPYSIHVGCYCMISDAGDLSDQTRRDRIAQIAHALLFPAVRELILAVTARQTWGMFSIGMSSLDLSGPPTRLSKKIASKKVAKKTKARI